MAKSIIYMLILLFSVPNLFAQQEPIKAKIIKDNVKVYLSPNNNSKLLGTYNKDTDVYILRSYWNWYRININGLIGWTKKNNILIPINEDLKVYMGIPPKLIDENPIDNKTKNIKDKKELQDNNIIGTCFSDNKMRKTQWSVVFGLNLTQYSSSENSFLKSNISHYYAGIKLYYNPNPFVSFNSGLIYSVKGIEFDNNSSIINFNIKYLEIPFSLKYAFSGIQNNSFYMSFGPYLDLYLSNSLKKEDGDLSNSLTTMDYGLNYAFGYQIALNPNNKFLIEGNYFLGTNSVFQENIPAKIYNYNFNINFGFIF